MLHFDANPINIGYIWLQSYEEFVNVKNNIKQKNLNTVLANISKTISRHPTHSSLSCHIFQLKECYEIVNESQPSAGILHRCRFFTEMHFYSRNWVIFQVSERSNCFSIDVWKIKKMNLSFYFLTFLFVICISFVMWSSKTRKYWFLDI